MAEKEEKKRKGRGKNSVYAIKVNYLEMKQGHYTELSRWLNLITTLLKEDFVSLPLSERDMIKVDKSKRCDMILLAWKMKERVINKIMCGNFRIWK